MRKHVVAASLGALAVAGLAWAASGSGLTKVGGGSILLPASTTVSASAPVVRATPAADSAAYQLTSDGKHIVDSYICVFKAGAVGRGQERGAAENAAGAAGGRIGHVYDVALQGFSLHASAQGVAQMQARNPRIQYCEQDAVATIIDPINALARPGGGGGQPAETTPFGIARVNGGVDGTGKTAWVIDTGIDLTHPDLNKAPQGTGNDGLSANFVSRETSANDLNGHGSHVAGTIGAIKGNGIGVVGVAAGAKVVAVRVLDRRGSGAYSDVIAGVNYVAKFGSVGDVANMSLGGPKSQALDDAVVAAASKVTFAVAAGNDGADTSAYSPGGIVNPNVYVVAAVSSTSSGDTWASFSNYGTNVRFAEPGVSILSTWKDGGYNTISGTSMATPHMAGLLLLGAVKTGGTVTRTGATDSYPIGVH